MWSRPATSTNASGAGNDGGNGANHRAAGVDANGGGVHAVEEKALRHSTCPEIEHPERSRWRHSRTDAASRAKSVAVT